MGNPLFYMCLPYGKTRIKGVSLVDRTNMREWGINWSEIRVSLLREVQKLEVSFFWL